MADVPDALSIDNDMAVRGRVCCLLVRTTSRLKSDGLHSGNSHWFGSGRTGGGYSARPNVTARLRTLLPTANSRSGTLHVKSTESQYGLTFDVVE